MSGSAYSGSVATSRSTPSCSSEGMPAKGSPGAEAAAHRGRPKPPPPPASAARHPSTSAHRVEQAPQRLAVGRSPGASSPSARRPRSPHRPRPRTRRPGPAPRRRAGWWRAARRGCRRPPPCAGRAGPPGRPARWSTAGGR